MIQQARNSMHVTDQSKVSVRIDTHNNSDIMDFRNDTNKAENGGQLMIDSDNLTFAPNEMYLK